MGKPNELINVWRPTFDVLCRVARVLYGHPPRHFGVNLSSCRVADLHQWLTERELMIKLVQQHLHRAQQRMKIQADKKRTERVFQVGDWVFLKLQPYVQSSVAARANHKLSFKYFGPYKIIAKIGAVAYRLQLPSTSAIHPVFHVSQLRRALGVADDHVAVDPPSPSQFMVPEKILETRRAQVGNAWVRQGKIKWSGEPVELSTWENLEELQHRFPSAPAWGHAGSQGGENVSTSTGKATSKGSKRAVSLRAKRPNVRLAGPEWVNA
ncbi:hypothetical protein QOZ80_5BG0433940 [Eleusine coracana subsp. coracana]|nr:hypothetical protein QOZ80_5BG0433940 [Eleusine coracana subsp. coracana]